jgi:hypothetical protein
MSLVRITEHRQGSYEHRYDMAAASRIHGNLDVPLLGYHDLTVREQLQNQFHNEVAALVALDHLESVPKLLDFDLEQLTLICEDLGAIRRSPEARDIPAAMEMLSRIHETWNRAEPSFRDVFHAIVDQGFYFEERDGLRGHDQGEFGDLLRDVPSIIEGAGLLPRRCQHGDVNGSNIFIADRGVCLIDFEDVSVSFQMMDVVGVLWHLGWSDERYLRFGSWIDAWSVYESGVADDGDFREFLYCVIRWTCKWLAKRVRSEGEFRARAGLALAAYSELRMA